MNLYGVLTKLVDATPWTDTERGHAIRLVGNLERLHAFGIAGEFDERSHDCTRAGDLFPDSMRCETCGKSMDPPRHDCVPAVVEHHAWRPVIRGEVRCGVCNAELDGG